MDSSRHYEVDEGERSNGVMLFGLPYSNSPPLTLRLEMTGWHEIRLGIFYGSGAAFIKDRALCAKLSDDITFSRFSCEHCRSEKDVDYPDKELGSFDIAETF